MAKFGVGAKPGAKSLDEVEATLHFCQGLIVQIDDLEAILYAELKPKLMGTTEDGGGQMVLGGHVVAQVITGEIARNRLAAGTRPPPALETAIDIDSAQPAVAKPTPAGTGTTTTSTAAPAAAPSAAPAAAPAATGPATLTSSKIPPIVPSLGALPVALPLTSIQPAGADFDPFDDPELNA